MYNKLITLAFLSSFALMSGVQAHKGEHKCANPNVQNAYNACKDKGGCSKYVKGDQANEKCRKDCQLQEKCEIQHVGQ